jgi:hypothetical protein
MSYRGRVYQIIRPTGGIRDRTTKEPFTKKKKGRGEAKPGAEKKRTT